MNIVRLEDGSEVQLVYYLGQFCIIDTEDGQEVVSSEMVVYDDLAKYIMGTTPTRRRTQ